MNSPEPNVPAARLRPRGFVPQAASRSSALSNSAGNADAEASGMLDSFAVARLYTTFQFKRAEYFPDGLDEKAFDMLVDLFLYEWLSRRAGASASTGMRLGRAAELPAGVQALVDSGLVVLMFSEEPDSTATISLSRAGRARLSLYFDHMARYISAI